MVRLMQLTWHEWREVGGAPWLCPGGHSPGPAVQGDGGGLLANLGPDRVGTHLRVPMTVLLVLVSHSKGARWAGRERGDGVAQAWANDSGGDEKAVVMWNWIVTQVTRVMISHTSLN